MLICHYYSISTNRNYIVCPEVWSALFLLEGTSAGSTLRYTVPVVFNISYRIAAYFRGGNFVQIELFQLFKGKIFTN